MSASAESGTAKYVQSSGNESADALLSLADRCEHAAGPDRELSAAIALAVHDWLSEVEGNKPLNCRLRNQFGSPVYIGGASPHMDYTASLDAAKSLMPSAIVEVYQQSGDGLNWMTKAILADGSFVLGYGFTEEGSRCAAALRARAADRNTQDEKGLGG